MKFELPSFFGEHTEGAEIRATKDKLTETRVLGALATSDRIHVRDLAVEAKGDTVRLNGTVPQERDVELVREIAQSVEGVIRVDAHITVSKVAHS